MLTVEEKLKAYVALVDCLELQLTAHHAQTHVKSTQEAIDAMLQHIYVVRDHVDTVVESASAGSVAEQNPDAGTPVATGEAPSTEQVPQVEQTPQTPSGEGSETPTA
jgi:hypothetical protein